MRTPPMRVVPACLIALLSFSTPPILQADVVVLQDGRTIEGEVTDQGDAYAVKTKYGTLSIRKEEVRKVVRYDALLEEARSFHLGGRQALEKARRPDTTPEMRQAELASAGESLKRALDLFMEARAVASLGDVAGLDRVIAALREEIALCGTPPAPASLAPVAPPAVPPAPPPAGAGDSSASPPEAVSGLLARWTLDDGAGDVARDASGCGRHGFLHNGAAWAYDRTRRGVRFNGTTASVDTEGPLRLGGPFSLAFWINPGETQTTYATVLGNQNRLDGAPVGVCVQQYADAVNAYWLVIGSGGTWLTSKPVHLKAGAWRHVAAVCDGREAVLYVDGSEASRAPMHGFPVPNRQDPFRLGRSCMPGMYFNGLLSDVRIYARPLSAREVEDLAAAAASEAPFIRLPVPEGPALAAAEKEIRSRFKEEYANRSAEGQAALAAALLRIGRETKDADALRYAAFREAQDVAAAAGDLATACAAIDRLGELFETDAAELKAAAFKAAARTRDPEVAERVCAAGLNLLDSLAAEDAYEAALKVSVPLEDLARRLKSAEMLRGVQARVKDLRAQQSEWNRIRASVARLKESPDDPEACLAVGKYHAAVKEDWEAALPLLAKGSHAGLKEAAAKDLARPAGGAARAELGDLWWSVAERESGAFKTALQRRARFHYEPALSTLSGLARARVEKRIEEAARAELARTPFLAGCILALDFEGAVPSKREGKDVLLLRDASGAGNAAVLEGGRLVPGPRGRCAVLEGAAVIRLEKPLPVGDAWTIAWHQLFEGPWTAAQRSLTTNGPWHHHVLIRPAGILCSVATSGEITPSAVDVSSLKGWHHLAAVGKGGETVFYIDGREAGRAKNQEKGPILLIGNYLSGEQPMINPVDNILVFRIALPPEAILSLARR